MRVDQQLDEDQQACVDAIEGVYIVHAGPGSGKTRTLVARYLNLMAHGVSDKDILSLTFTAEAAAEMASRSGVVNSKDVFRTFHSFVLDLMQREREYLNLELKSPILPWEFEDYDLRQRLVKNYPIIGKVEKLKEYISSQKRAGVSSQEALDKEQGMGQFFAQAYDDYERICRKEGWLDFDSLMVEGVALLERNEEVRNRNKKKYIMVDEFQDTDEIQIKLLKLIFEGNVFFVGDLNQSIYEFRGARPEIMSKIREIFPGAETRYLGTNYRSVGALVEFFKEITPVDNGLASRMRTMNPYGEKPTFTRYRDDYEEAAQVLSRIEDPPNTAIIARTNRQLFRYQQACFSKGIKCKILGRKAFWEQNEVKQLLSLAKSTKFPADYTAPMVLKALVIQHRLLEKYKWSGNVLEPDPADNINSVYKLSAKYKTVDEFLDFIRRLTYGSKAAKTPCLTLSTCHQAKGREWKHVFAVGLTEGILPHNRATHTEEKRIWFVMSSRAAEKLHVTFYKNPSMFLNDYAEKIIDYKPKEVSDGLPVS